MWDALIARGADVEATDAAGNTVLHAVAAQKERAGVVYKTLVMKIYDAAPQVWGAAAENWSWLLTCASWAESTERRAGWHRLPPLPASA